MPPGESYSPFHGYLLSMYDFIIAWNLVGLTKNVLIDEKRGVAFALGHSWLCTWTWYKLFAILYQSLWPKYLDLTLGEVVICVNMLFIPCQPWFGKFIFKICDRWMYIPWGYIHLASNEKWSQNHSHFALQHEEEKGTEQNYAKNVYDCALMVRERHLLVKWARDNMF